MTQPDEVTRTPRPRRMHERIYRVAGYPNRHQQYISTFTYHKLAEAEYRADLLRRRGELIEFSFADISWLPHPTDSAASCTHTRGGDDG